MSDHAKISIKDFVQTRYRAFWKENNLSKNTFFPEEQLMAVERHVLFAASKIHMKAGDSHKTTEVAGETSKYHMAGDATIQDSVKGMAQNYRREPACRFFYPIGNLGDSVDNKGAAARYTSVGGTPLSDAIIADMPYVEWEFDSRMGVHQPKMLSVPLPLALIRGVHQIGTGKSTIIAEHPAREVMEWIQHNLVDQDEQYDFPDPSTCTGSKVIPADLKNGQPYINYVARWHREGSFDVITNIPPKKSVKMIVQKLGKHLPKRVYERVHDASGDGRQVWLMVPKGYLDKLPSLYAVDLQFAQREQPYIWDEELDTMRLSSHEEIAQIWLDARCNVVAARIRDQIQKKQDQMHKIDLIEEFAKRECQKMKAEEVESIFGKEDAAMLMALSVRTFMPEKIRKNREVREQYEREVKNLQSDLDDVQHVVIREAYDIIAKQEEFFDQVDM